MKYFIISTISILWSFCMQAQDVKIEYLSTPPTTRKPSKPAIVLDTTILYIQYRQTIIHDTINKSKVSENRMLLQIGKNRISKYADYLRLKGDSITNILRKENADINTLLNKTGPYNKGAIKESIFKNYPTNNITTVDNFAASNYKIEEPMTTPAWNLANDTDSILGYLCYKAQTKLFGRNYTVWYTPTISVSEGPWKLFGLPGLILKAEDDTHQIKFECISIENIKWVNPIIIEDRHYIKADKKKYLKAFKEYKENPHAAMMSTGLIEGQTGGITKKEMFNPIELTE